MDPLADKLLVCSALICFVELDKLPAWMVIIIIAREFIISGFRLVASDNGIVIAASWWGKSKTISQMIMIILLIADIPALSVLNTVLIWVALILTVVSLIDYLVKIKTCFPCRTRQEKAQNKTLTGLGFQTGSVFLFVVFQRFFPEAAERKRRTIWSIFAASCLDFPALMAEMIRSARRRKTVRRPDFPASGREETASFPSGIFRGSESHLLQCLSRAKSIPEREGSCDQSFCLSSELIADPPHFRDLYSEASGPSAWSETSGREDPAADRRQNGKYPAASQAERRAGHQQTSWKGRPDGKKAEWSAGARAICSKSQGRLQAEGGVGNGSLQHLKLILCDHLSSGVICSTFCSCS